MSAHPHPNQFALLRQRRFAPFFWTQFLGAANDNVFKNALVILVAFLTAQLTAADVNFYTNLAAGLFLMTSLGIGLLASTFANTQQEAVLTVMFTLLPSVFLSGFFFPVDAMPPFLQLVSRIVPLRYYLVIIRSLLLKGVGVAALQGEIAALGLFAILILGAAAMRFRKRLD